MTFYVSSVWFFIPYFDIHIKNTFTIFSEHYVDPDDEPVELFVVTLEEESLFQAAYPDLVALYQGGKSEVLQKKQKSKSRSLFLTNLCVFAKKQKTFLPLLNSIMPKQDEVMMPRRDCALILLFYTFALRNMNCDLYAIQSALLLFFFSEKKDRPEEKVLPNAYDEVTSLLSQMNLKPTYRILPGQHSMSHREVPPEDQTQQRSTASKDAALPSASCTSTVHMSASAAALADSSVPSQCTKYSGMSSSVPAGLQLSSADGKGTSFSTSPAHGGADCDPAADLATCIKHSRPLSHETVRNSSEYSDVTQYDVLSDSEDDLFSNDAMGQLQKWSLSERILKKAPIPSQPLSEDVGQLESLNCFKQSKETLNPDRNHASSSCQLSNLVQKSKNVLSQNSASESSVPIYQDAYKKADILAEMGKKDPYTSGAACLAFSGQTTETLHPGCEMLPACQKPADATGCHIKEACIETTRKASLKKSVCQNRCSSSEDSDDGHVDKILVYDQQKRQLNPGQFKKYFTKKRSSVVTSKRTNSDSALTIKEKKTTNLKAAVNSFSVQVSLKPSSVEEVNCSQSPDQPIERLGSPTQEDKSAVLTYAWADSPLPLSERLKRRIKIN